MIEFNIYRKHDTWRPRKVVIEAVYNGKVLDQRRMFAFPLFLFAWKLERRKARMTRCVMLMLGAMIKGQP